MKALPKRKGNCPQKVGSHHRRLRASMKALPKRKGNTVTIAGIASAQEGLNESPSQKEGKSGSLSHPVQLVQGLNESPSQKEGKLAS